jgi:hypothetical protein
MSLGSIFSSPTKTADAAASADQGITQADINQAETYTGGLQAATRSAIADLGENPYLGAAGQMSTAPYAVNAADTQNFGSAGPGTQLAPANTFTGGSSPPPTSTPTQPPPGYRAPQPVARSIGAGSPI